MFHCFCGFVTQASNGATQGVEEGVQVRVGVRGLMRVVRSYTRPPSVVCTR